MLDIKKMPKIELHLHLDGSLDTEDVKNRYKLTDDEIKERMIADEKCKDLNDYLTKFDFPISIMQKKLDLEKDTIALLSTLKSQNVIYAEIRFAPQFHTKVVLCVVKIMKKIIMKL